MLETFIDILIAIYLNLSYPLLTFSGDIIAYSFAIFCAIACSLTLLSTLYIIYKPTHIMQDPVFSKKWGALYNILGTHNKF